MCESHAQPRCTCSQRDHKTRRWVPATLRLGDRRHCHRGCRTALRAPPSLADNKLTTFTFSARTAHLRYHTGGDKTQSNEESLAGQSGRARLAGELHGQLSATQGLPLAGQQRDELLSALGTGDKHLPLDLTALASPGLAPRLLPKVV